MGRGEANKDMSEKSCVYKRWEDRMCGSPAVCRIEYDFLGTYITQDVCKVHRIALISSIEELGLKYKVIEYE